MRTNLKILSTIKSQPSIIKGKTEAKDESGGHNNCMGVQTGPMAAGFGKFRELTQSVIHGHSAWKGTAWEQGAEVGEDPSLLLRWKKE